MDALVFYSKIDWWLGAILLGMAILLLLLPLWEWKYNQDRSMPSKVFVSMVCWSSSLLILWMMLTVKYRLTDEQLIVGTGLGETTIATDAITQINPIYNSTSAPALSLDRLKVEYIGNDDKQESIVISPKDKPLFLAAIQQREPSLKLDSGGSGLVKISGD